MMETIFLSASVPMPNRRGYEDSNPFLIQTAVRELVIATVRDRHIVWGGHPSITPMVWSICHDLGIEYSENVTLYQSLYYEELFPEENSKFKNVRFVEAIPDDELESLTQLRTKMIASHKYSAAVFIGGMEGIAEEFDLFRTAHPDARMLSLAAPGGVSREFSVFTPGTDEHEIGTVNFSGLFRSVFPPTEPPGLKNKRRFTP